MSSVVAEELEEDHREVQPADSRSEVFWIPRIAVQGFCETAEVARAIEACAEDRRMRRAHVKVHMGGISAAVEFYNSAPTPNLIILETRSTGNTLVSQLEQLADVCDAGTKVVVIGHSNDVLLYRELTRRGISDYLVAPLQIFDVMRTIADIYHDPGSEPLGRTIAFIGAKGGCGSSTIAHNVGWAISSDLKSDAVVADMDLPFGTGGLDFNQDPPQGIAEAVMAPDRIDDVFLDRLLSKCSDQLSLLAAPASLDRTYDFDEGAFDPVIDVVRQNVPTVLLDVPHMWSDWVRSALANVDEVVLTVEPDLANLRNAKNLVDHMKQARPNDSEPRLVINRVNMPKRPEIKPEEIAQSLELPIVAIIPFDAHLFGTAANNGQMISELDAKSPVGGMFRTIAQTATGRTEVRKQKKGPLAPFLARFKGKKGG